AVKFAAEEADPLLELKRPPEGEPEVVVPAPVGDPVKVLAQTSTTVFPIRRHLVIRSGEDLVKETKVKTDAASATKSLAKDLKVEAIDWNKQMVIAVSGGQQPT